MLGVVYSLLEADVVGETTAAVDREVAVPAMLMVSMLVVAVAFGGPRLQMSAYGAKFAI